jgi:hypothetical protein
MLRIVSNDSVRESFIGIFQIQTNKVFSNNNASPDAVCVDLAIDDSVKQIADTGRLNKISPLRIQYTCKYAIFAHVKTTTSVHKLTF